jgi:hypothetical protein
MSLSAMTSVFGPLTRTTEIAVFAVGGKLRRIVNTQRAWNLCLLGRC